MLLGVDHSDIGFEMLAQDQQPAVDLVMRDGADPAAVGKPLAWVDR